MKQLDYLKSFSRSGLSLIEVNVKQEFWADQLPQVWDEMRRKIRDIETTLPPGAGRPIISDDFGDVFGLLLAITGDGYSYAELEKYAKDLRTELPIRARPSCTPAHSPARYKQTGARGWRRSILNIARNARAGRA